MLKKFKIPAILGSFLFLLAGCGEETPPIQDDVPDVVNSFKITTSFGLGSNIKILTTANEDGLYNEKSEIDFKVTLLENYELISVAVNSTELDITSDNLYTFIMPSEDVVITTKVNKVETPIITDNISTLEGLEEIIPNLLAYDEGINEQTYQIKQQDNYSALDIYSVQEGTITKYNDFYEDKFTQYFDDAPENALHGVIQRGISTYLNQDVFYNITDYEEDDTSDSVMYAYYDESAKDYVFGVGFGHYYYYNYFMSTLAPYIESNPEGILETNFNKNSFIDNGILMLMTNFYVGEKDSPDFQLQRYDTLTIENGVVVKAETESLQGMGGNVNFKLQTSVTEFKKGEIKDFSGEKLDPANYQIKA